MKQIKWKISSVFTRKKSEGKKFSLNKTKTIDTWCPEIAVNSFDLACGCVLDKIKPVETVTNQRKVRAGRRQSCSCWKITRWAFTYFADWAHLVVFSNWTGNNVFIPRRLNRMIIFQMGVDRFPQWEDFFPLFNFLHLEAAQSNH